MMSASAWVILLGRARVLEAGGETLGQVQALLDLAQGQQPAIG